MDIFIDGLGLRERHAELARENDVEEFHAVLDWWRVARPHASIWMVCAGDRVLTLHVGRPPRADQIPDGATVDTTGPVALPSPNLN